jgi:serine/threonine protein kinase
MLEISGQTAGKYLIMERVGHGGMSAIYKALDTTTNKIVAVKVLSAAMASDPTFEARFTREIEVLRSLDHPHILPILDYGEIRGLPYIVMPYYSHGTLKDRIDQGMTLEQGAKIVEQVAEALEYAHARGITHRDVKPSNVLLDEDGNAVLSDFGFAHLSDSSLSLTGSSLLGTPAYMSPEQCRGEEINGASDQYSLAIVIFEMVTGKPPFEAETPMSLVFKHLNDPVPNPRDINHDLPEEVEDVLLKALRKDRNRRYPSIAAFNQAFQIAVAPHKSQLSARARAWQQLTSRSRRFGRRISQSVDGLRRSPRFMRSFRIGATLAIFLSVPIAYWGIVAFGPGSSGANAAGQIDATSIAGTLMATLDNMSEDEIATAVQAAAQATLDSMPTATEVAPTPTETATPTATPTETPNPWFYPSPTPRTPIPVTVHVRSLVAQTRRAVPDWDALVTVQIKMSNGDNAVGAWVYVEWSESGLVVDTSCQTSDSGRCTLENLGISTESTLLTVTSVVHPYHHYNPADNWVTQIYIEPRP